MKIQLNYHLLTSALHPQLWPNHSHWKHWHDEIGVSVFQHHQLLHQHLHYQDPQQHHKFKPSSWCIILMCTVCMHLLCTAPTVHCLHKLFNCSTTYFCYTINTVLIQSTTLTTIFYICSPVCTQAHTFPIILCVNVRWASWFISCVVSPENQRAFLCIPCWGEHQGWEEETGMSVDVSDSLSDHSGSSVFVQRGRHSSHCQKLGLGREFS